MAAYPYPSVQQMMKVWMAQGAANVLGNVPVVPVIDNKQGKDIPAPTNMVDDLLKQGGLPK